MAVKIKVQITLSKVVDVDSIYRYYILKSSTDSAPSKPTTYRYRSINNKCKGGIT